VVVAQREQLEPADRAGWRQWLAGHHDTSPGVWLVLHRKSAGPQPLTLEDAVEEALCFGWIDSTLRRLDEGRNVLLFTPRRAGGTWSQTNKSRVTRLLEQGLMAPAGIRAVERAWSDGSWTLLESIDAVWIPPDLAAALAVDPVATAGFNAMTTSEKKNALWWIASAKRPATRLARIEETIRLTAAADRTRRDS
jgi:uncharacterized protein YdeI (YjbR/CyaY-like superfamily)